MKEISYNKGGGESDIDQSVDCVVGEANDQHVGPQGWSFSSSAAPAGSDWVPWTA